MRPDHCPQGLLPQKTLSGKTTAYPLLRCREQQNIRVSDQQFYPSGNYHCRALSLPLAGGAVFQMDQAASQNQSLLWDNRKCRENSNLDSYLSLRSRGYNQKKPETGPESLHNSTDFERHPLRENAHFTSTCKYRLQRTSDTDQQPAEFIR